VGSVNPTRNHKRWEEEEEKSDRGLAAWKGEVRANTGWKPASGATVGPPDVFLVGPLGEKKVAWNKKGWSGEGLVKRTVKGEVRTRDSKILGGIFIKKNAIRRTGSGTKSVNQLA